MSEKMSNEEIARMGGEARAAKLSAERQSEIGRTAAMARWYPKATHEGVLKLGETQIQCFVLEDGRRVLSQSGLMRSLGRSKSPPTRPGDPGDDETPYFLRANGIKPFVSEDLLVATRPILFRHSKGGGTAHGYVAELLPKICAVFEDARDAGALKPHQMHLAERAKILMRALATVGIVGLVDEATGFQSERDKQALQSLLEKYLRHELAAWAKRFPDEFYREIFRLRGWQWKGMSVNRPQAVAHYTRDLVYERLAPGILEELEARSPKDESGRRKSKFHQWMSDDVGHPALAQHLHTVTAFMRASQNWDAFLDMVDRALPRKGRTLKLPLVA